MITDQQWRTVQDVEQQNDRLLRLSNEIFDLATDIHAGEVGRELSEERGLATVR